MTSFSASKTHETIVQGFVQILTSVGCYYRGLRGDEKDLIDSI